MALLETYQPMDDESRFNSAFHEIVLNYPPEDVEKMRQISREAAVARGRPAVAQSYDHHPEIHLG